MIEKHYEGTPLFTEERTDLYGLPTLIGELKPDLKHIERIINEIPCGIALVHDVDARLALANQAATQAWGAQWQAEQPIQEFLRSSDVQVYRGDGTPLPVEELVAMQALQQGERMEPQQIFIRHPDGSAHLFLTHTLALDSKVMRLLPAGSARTTSEPEPWAMIVLQDVTSQQEVEQLKQEMKALKEAERIKDDFIATAAHELRRPLTALMGYTEMLKQQAASSRGAELAEWQIEALETIAHDTTRIVNLTNDLLDVTRLQASQLELHRYTTNLVNLAYRVIARQRDTTGIHTLVIDAQPSRIVASLDSQRIEQVLSNLLSNAMKYSPQGGQILLTIRVDQEAGIAALAVHDQGIGIPASQHTRIFSRFFRADNARAIGIEGTGLGLYLCRELIHLHDGRIWFESVEGQGSTFYVSLPLAIGPGM